MAVITKVYFRQLAMLKKFGFNLEQLDIKGFVVDIITTKLLKKLVPQNIHLGIELKITVIHKIM